MKAFLLLFIVALSLACTAQGEHDPEEYERVYKVVEKHMHNAMEELGIPTPTPYVIVATPTPTPVPPLSVVYREDFTEGANGWESAYSSGYCCNLPEEQRHALYWQDGIVHSHSLYPHLWWPDGNHTSWSPWWESDPNIYGTEWLNMVFWTRTGLPMDLRDATITMRIKADGSGGNTLPTGVGPGKQANLVFWWQSYDESIGKGVNFAAVGKPLDANLVEGWNTVSITPELEDYICLGSSALRDDDYGCSPIENLIGSVDSSWGVIIFGIDPENIPVGDVWLDWIEISK